MLILKQSQTGNDSKNQYLSLTGPALKLSVQDKGVVEYRPKYNKRTNTLFKVDVCFINER